MPTILLAQGYYYSQFGVVAFRLFANYADSTPVPRSSTAFRPSDGNMGKDGRTALPGSTPHDSTVAVCVRTPVEEVRQMIYGRQQFQATQQRVQETFFAHIHEKRKTVEGCIASGYAERVFPGDSLRIECGGTYVDVKVLSMVKYKSFREMLQYEGVRHCLPDCNNIDAGVAIYHSFQHFEKLAAQLGVIAYRITPDMNDTTPVPRPVLALRGGKLTHVLTRHEIGILSSSDNSGKQPEKEDVTNKVTTSRPVPLKIHAHASTSEVSKRSLPEVRGVKECCKRCRVCGSIRDGD